MVKCLVLLILAQLMVCEWCGVDGQDIPLAGGLQELKTDDPDLQAALEAIRPQVAFQLTGSPSAKFKYVKVLKAHSQIVAGTKYYVKFKLIQSRSSGSKQKSSNTTAKASMKATTKICRAQI